MHLAQPTIKGVVMWNWFCAGLYFVVAAIFYGAELSIALGQESVVQASLSLADHIRSTGDVDTLRKFALSCVEISQPGKGTSFTRWLPSQFASLIFGVAFFFTLSAYWTSQAHKKREKSDDC